jgi:alkylation response protein AidB-like acyl-CoA dehydrogenase
MDFALSDEHRALRSGLRQFFERVAPTGVISDLDRNEEYPGDIYKEMAAIDLCGVTISPEYGGAPADEIAICIIMEEIARAGACLAYLYAPTVTFCARGINIWGTEAQRVKILPGIARGEITFAMGLTEPDVGSDLTHLATRARKDGDSYVVNGQKEGYSGTHDVMRSLSNPAACHHNKNGLFMKGFSYHTQSAEQAITCIISPGSTAKKSSTCASGSTPRNKRQEARIGRHVSGFSNRWWPR